MPDRILAGDKSVYDAHKMEECYKSVNQELVHDAQTARIEFLEQVAQQAIEVVGLAMNENLNYTDTLYWSNCPDELHWKPVVPPKELAAYLRELANKHGETK